MKIEKSTLLVPAIGLLSAGICAWIPPLSGFNVQIEVPVAGEVRIDRQSAERASTSISPANKTVAQSPDVNPAHDSEADDKEPGNRGDVKNEEEKRILTKDGRVYPIRQYKTLLNPNDTYANQWWLGTNNMQALWDIPFGSRQTTIAIIDTGYALNHQEFSGRWATNGGEVGATTLQNASKLNCTDQGLPLNRSCNNIDDNFDGILDNESGATTRQNPSLLNCTAQGIPLDKSCNRRDDDSNGYIDDFRGWDFSNSDPSVQAGQTNPDGDGTTHGTMVAGIAAATGNNGVGIAGVNWYSRILPIQALNDDDYGDTYTVGNAVYYAADQGVDVISISLGTTADDPYLREAISYALDKGAVVVAAAGNDGCDCMLYPARYPEVIAVGSANSAGNRSSFSSYGSALDILAPGEGMTTSSWSKTNGVSSYSGNAAGTSFATPFVAGLYGLARSHQPTATWDEITGAMFENANRSGLSAASPRNNGIGYGRTNAHAMLQRMVAPHTDIMRHAFSPYAGGTDRAYQCDGTIPATPLHQLTRSSGRLLTVNEMIRYQASLQGWSSNVIAYACMGLPTDTVDVLRTLNLPAEIANSHIKQ